ncbi:MAG TPA: hypothetical protein VGG20_11285 [Thermoanaerobaculia bacterium]|jgi:hypothetical protein
MERKHLERSLLKDFLRGTLPREQVRFLVRHLLSGCPDCTSVASSVYREHPFSLEWETSLDEDHAGDLDAA